MKGPNATARENSLNKRGRGTLSGYLWYNFPHSFDKQKGHGTP
ncbi:hypothetical protein SAMN05421578_11563 [Paenibacillus macquariensis]|uniref:Uncharacterized protein n=1 Tax=Paenibacillus macquariensis TaxID=948756 RepID=A0ABY1K9S6_9BACL|nr:hypothetical protein SAMN05421578_11563 [Paenibacillus macquariensis]